mmetsp:Transcript_115463/g.222443  ORF Transcript_115463/g.222443 Transcript_115463/m.222443 type:complete len:427 (-) Transcript_115463:39-1319(-)
MPPKKLKRKPKTPAAAGGDVETGATSTKPLNGTEQATGLTRPGELVEVLAAQLNFTNMEAEWESEAAAEAARKAVTSELPEFRGALRQLHQRLGGLKTAAQGMIKHLCPDGEDELPSGCASYVDVKVQLLLSYLVCLTYYMLLKARGVPVRDHPVTLRLLWVRSLLEKLKPVDQRLQYQMNRLLEMAEAKAGTAPTAASDPRALRPGELAASVEDEGDAEEEMPDAPDQEAEDDGIYRPPRIAQVEYTGDHVGDQERAERDFEREKRRLERSEFMRTLREEFNENPAEIRGSNQSAAAERAERKLAEVQRYEEDNMVRLRPSKKERKETRQLLRTKRMSSGGTMSLDEAADFRDLAASLDGDVGGRGRGRKRGAARGSMLQRFEGAAQRVREARGIVESTFSGRMPQGSKRGRSGGGGGGGKRRKG